MPPEFTGAAPSWISSSGVIRLLDFAAGPLFGVELDMDQVRAGDSHRPAQVRLVHTVVFDIETSKSVSRDQRSDR
jgi:hypothetical protein